MEFKLDYYLTTDHRWLKNFSDMLSEVTGYTSEIKENNLILPPEIGDGTFELTTFGDGLSLMKVDGTFHVNLKVNRCADPKNEEFVVHFNMSENPIYASHTNRKIDVQSNFSEAIYYSSSGVGLETDISKGEHVKLLFLVADRHWINANIAEGEMSKSPLLRQFLGNQHVQGILNMDLVDFNLVREILDDSLADNVPKLHNHGLALTLLAHFFKKVNKRERMLEKEVVQDTQSFILLKDKLIDQLYQPWPTLDCLAGEFNMSKTKFIQSFTRIFGKNYSQFYLDIRMEKASKMILDGESVSTAGMEVGYTNLGHFSKIFKRYYGISPKKYVKRKELILEQEEVIVAC